MINFGQCALNAIIYSTIRLFGISNWNNFKTLGKNLLEYPLIVIQLKVCEVAFLKVG